MSVKFFGQFLLAQQSISRQQLLDAIALQEQQNLPLGAYAVKNGYMSAADADKINRAQRGMDERFGDLAVEMRLLSSAQVSELLTLQQNDHIRIGEALVELGHIDQSSLDVALEEFSHDQAAYRTGHIEFPPGTPHAPLLEIAVDLTQKLFLRIAGVRSKLGPAQEMSNLPDASLVTASITFTGALTSEYVLSMSTDVARRVAESMLGSSSGIDGEVIADTVKEMCNIVCGNAIGKFAQTGKRVDITTPLDGAPMVREDDKGVFVSLYIPDGIIEVRICNEVVA